MEFRSLGPGMAGRGGFVGWLRFGVWAGSLSPVCREGSHDGDDDDGDEVFSRLGPAPVRSIEKWPRALLRFLCDVVHSQCVAQAVSVTNKRVVSFSL